MEERENLLPAETILNPDEVAGLFNYDNDTGGENEGGRNANPEEKENDNADADITNPEEIEFGGTQEEVGDEEKKDDGSPNPDGDGAFDKNVFSSFANTLVEEGVFTSEYDITDGQSLVDAMQDEIDRRVDEAIDDSQRRVLEALNYGVQPSKIQQYESTLKYLNGLTEDNINDESENGDKLRRNLIYTDYLMRGFSEDKARKEVTKSINAQTDIDDAKDALESLRKQYEKGYNNEIAAAKREQEESVKRQEKFNKEVQDYIHSSESAFGGLEMTESMRQKAIDMLTKPRYKDSKTGELMTEIDRYRMEHPMEFIANVSMAFALTNGFKEVNALVKKEAQKKARKSFNDLENALNGSRRTAAGKLDFMGGTSKEASPGLWDFAG